MSDADEAQALAYRNVLAQGQRNRLARVRRLAGSGQAVKTLRDNWKPIRDWLQERDLTR